MEDDLKTQKLQQEHFDLMSTSLQSLRIVENYTDALIISNGKTFPVHRNILHAGSAYFAAMFQADMKEAATGKVSLDAIDPHILSLVLDFIYTGQLGNTAHDENTLQSLLSAAHLLRVDLLYDYCWTTLKDHLSPTNFLDLWNLADLYGGDAELLKKIPVLVGKNFLAVAESEEFCLMSTNQLRSVLQASSLAVITEVAITQIQKWVRHNEEERIADFPMLLDMVNLELVSNNFLLKMIADCLIKKCKQLYDRCIALSLTRLQLASHLKPKLVCFTETSKVTTYSLEEKTWDTLKDLPFTILKGMVAKELNGCVYFVGGQNSDGTIHSFVYHYMPSTNSMQRNGRLDYPVEKIKLSVFKERLYIFGRAKNQTDRIKIQSYNHEIHESEGVGIVKEHCDGYFVVVVAEKMYVFLESILEDYSRIFTIIDFDPFSNRGEVIKKVTTEPHNYRSLMAYDQRICLTTKKFHNIFDPKTDEWDIKPFKGPDYPDMHILDANSDEKILVFGTPSNKIIVLYWVNKDAYDEIQWYPTSGELYSHCVLMNQ